MAKLAKQMGRDAVAVTALVVVLSALLLALDKPSALEDAPQLSAEIAQSASYAAALSAEADEHAQVWNFDPQQAAPVSQIPMRKGIVSFVLCDDAPADVVARASADIDIAPIEEAYSAIADEASAGFVFVDLATGAGIACNAHGSIYPASSFKAIASYFALSQADDGEVAPYTLSNIERAIRDSDNDAYDALCGNLPYEEYRAWLVDHGIDEREAQASYYPKASAAQMASFWLEIYRWCWLDGEEDADAEEGSPAWFKGLLDETSVSFIRDALGDDADVFGKAGWITDSYWGNSVSETAIIEAGDSRWLMVIMTAQPDTQESHERVSELARALFTMRQMGSGPTCHIGWPFLREARHRVLDVTDGA